MFKPDKEREAYIIGHMKNVVFHHTTDRYIITSKGMWGEWEYWGLLWTWGKTQSWWGYFVRDVIGEDSGFFGPLFYPISQNFIDAESMAKAMYKYLKELEELKK